LASIGEFVQSYLPNVDPSGLSPDYSGIRPNISAPGSAFTDFMIRHDIAKGRKGMVELLGFNSPGLTSSLATGRYVAGMVRQQVWGQKVSRRDVETLADGWE
jgi:L-2-hydroxyglutarate oxidase LhgO